MRNNEVNEKKQFKAKNIDIMRKSHLLLTQVYAVDQVLAYRTILLLNSYETTTTDENTFQTKMCHSSLGKYPKSFRV